jgi:hypothetical protein
MSTITKRYFIAEGDAAQAVANEGLRLANESRLAGITLAKKYGALGTFGRGTSAPFALAWDDGLLPDPNPGFLAPERHRQGSDVYLVCRPDKRTTVGKAIADELGALPLFNFSDYACQQFDVQYSTIGAHADSRSGLAMYKSGAGYVGQQLVFMIPSGGDRDSAPVIPPAFREIKRSEYIALTEEGEQS